MKLDSSYPELLELLENILHSALREVRAARARQPVPPPQPMSPQEFGKLSHTKLCIDILNSEGRPLHISALISAMAQRDVVASRESVVSALSKKLSPRGPFVRVARNTFGLAGRDSLVEPTHEG